MEARTMVVNFRSKLNQIGDHNLCIGVNNDW